MPDDFQISAIALIAALMLAFAYLHMRFRSVRTFLWILALLSAEIQAVLVWLVSNGPAGIRASSSPAMMWMRVTAESALMLSSVLFLASLSPFSFKVGNRRILYAAPYLASLLLYSILYYHSYPSSMGHHASGRTLWIYGFLAFWAAAVAFVWSLQKGAIPVWLAAALVAVAALVCVPSFFHGDVYWPMQVVESGNMIMTALLVVFTYRRMSPGILLATFGFGAWALTPFFLMQVSRSTLIITVASLILARAAVLGKVFVAIGLLVLVLEDQVQKNQLARQRERRVRMELEVYARQALTARSLEEFDRDSSQLCRMIVDQSSFRSSAMVVRGITGAYTMVGYAAMDGATAGALDSLAQRVSADRFIEAGVPLVPDSKTLDLDLTAWLVPGDDLERLGITRIGVVPMLGPGNSAEGALLLIGPRVPIETLRADDLLPLEILAGRLQAARSQSLMLGKLIDSERFAGVGQLASNVAQQLYNPLTVILGYAALLEEYVPSGFDRRGTEAIGVEAMRMKGILERLSRFSRISTERFSSFSVAELVSDIEQFHRADFLRHSIEFRLVLPPTLPNIFGNTHQIRQALLHATQYAVESVSRVTPNEEKSVRIEASVVEGRVQITIAHSGRGFSYPERAFDTLSSGFSTTEATGIGLSLCAAIVREHRGNISAVNYEPSGAAVVVELPIRQEPQLRSSKHLSAVPKIADAALRM